MFARSYLDLSRDERTMCCSLWIPPSEAPTRYAMNSSQQSEPGWFAFDHRIQWNLSASPAALQKYFIEQIKLACLIQKFQSKKTNEGKQNAPATWDYIEILDRKKNRIGLPLNDSEKQKVKDGMKLAKKFHEEYRQALKDWLKNTDSSDTEEPNDVEE